MSNELVVQSKIGLSEITEYAKLFAASGYFQDSKELAQAATKIIFGTEYGLSPGQSMSGIYIVKGKPALAAATMAGLAKRAGYRIVTVEHTDKICSLQFYDRNGEECGPTIDFTIEDAKKTSSSEMLSKYPKNMLWARAVSNGCKWYCSDVFAGAVYTPEELIDQAYAETEDEQPKQRTRRMLESVPVSPQDSTQGVSGSTAGKPAIQQKPAQKPQNGAEVADAMMKPGNDEVSINELCQAVAWEGSQDEIIRAVLKMNPDVLVTEGMYKVALTADMNRWEAAAAMLKGGRN